MQDLNLKNLIFCLTYQCNSRCRMCGIWTRYRGSPSLKGSEMNPKQIEKLFLESEMLKRGLFLIITGGEPLLRDDFLELYRFFRTLLNKSTIDISTNGIDSLLISERLKIMTDEFGEDRLSIGLSLDGIGTTHDYMRGVQGAFKNAITVLKLLTNKYPKISVHVSFTITPDNYRDLLATYKLSREYGVGFGARIAQTSRLYYGKHCYEARWPEDKLNDLESIMEGLLAEKRRESPINEHDIRFLSGIVPYEHNPSRKFPCRQGTHSAFLDPYGNLYPCNALERKIGSILNDNLDRLWFSEEAGLIRDYIARKICHCWTECAAYGVV